VFNFVGLLSRGILPPKVVVSKVRSRAALCPFNVEGQAKLPRNLTCLLRGRHRVRVAGPVGTHRFRIPGAGHLLQRQLVLERQVHQPALRPLCALRRRSSSRYVHVALRVACWLRERESVCVC
jgi:hypothetical protein